MLRRDPYPKAFVSLGYPTKIPSKDRADNLFFVGSLSKTNIFEPKLLRLL